MSPVYSFLNLRAVSRHQMFVLAGILFLSALPHFFNLHLSIALFFSSIIAFKLLIVWFNVKSQPRWMNFIFLIAGITIVVIQYSGSIGKDFGVSLLVAMLGLKILEISNYRDAYVLIFLTGFMQVTQFLYNQEILLAAYIFSLSLASVFFLFWLNQSNSKIDFLRTSKQVFKLALLALPVMIVLFVLFPRLNGPLWGFKDDGGLAVTGITGEISPGSISRLSQSSATAFRVTFDDPELVPAPEKRYWRGPVLVKTDGYNWTSSKIHRPAKVDFQGRGEQVSYRITLEPSQQNWIFALDLPSELPDKTYITKYYAVRSAEKIKSRQTFNLKSYPDYLATQVGKGTRREALELPENISDRMKEFAIDLYSRSGSDLNYIDKVLSFFNQENFVYTLSPPPLGDNPADEFLFESRQGFCEHYATSFVLLMRLANIPARVVAGYQGGEWNPTGNYLLIKQSDAHAWVEVLLDGSGWVRLDPTSAVAPERVIRSIDPDAAAEGSPVLFELSTQGTFGQLLKQAIWITDSLDLNWHRWVVGFSQERQRYFLKNVGLDFLKGYKLALAAILVPVLIFSIVLLFIRNRKVENRDRAKIIWDKFINKLEAKGLNINDSDGPLDTARKAGEILTEKSDSILLICNLYIKVRYSNNQDSQHLDNFRKMVADFK